MGNIDLNIEIIGLLAATCTTAAFIPQAYKVWKTKEVKDVSLTMYIVMLTGICLWFTYGLHIQSLSVLAANTVSFVIVLSIIILKLRYSNKG